VLVLVIVLVIDKFNSALLKTVTGAMAYNPALDAGLSMSYTVINDELKSATNIVW